MNQPNKPKTSRAIADLSAGTILASVDIGVPLERVFTALTTEQVTKWWGGAGAYQTTEWSADVRLGGQWRAGGKMADGSPFAVEGEYLAVEPPHRLVQTWKPDWEAGHTTTLTYRLEAIAGGTRLTLRHDGFVNRTEALLAHGEGWEMVLGWLAAHLAPARPAGRLFVCKLVGPRPSFPADMNEAEGRVMHEHMAYWRTLLDAGTAVVFGPVAEPHGVWGLGLIEVADEAAARALIAEDPTVRSGLGFRLDVYPMLDAVVRH